MVASGERGSRTARVQNFYATRYGKDEKPESMRVKLVLKALNVLGPVHRILDVGCGDGSLSAMLARSSDQIAGIEVSMDACRIARSRGVGVTRADVENYAFPFQPESFDVVVAGEVIEHMADPDEFLQWLPGMHARVLAADIAGQFQDQAHGQRRGRVAAPLRAA